MEGDVIHDCPKLKPAPNDQVERQQNWGSGASFTRLKELQGLHATLHDGILEDMVYDYGSQISDFGDLPHDIKMHSKEKHPHRMISNQTEGIFNRCSLILEKRHYNDSINQEAFDIIENWYDDLVYIQAVIIKEL